MIIEKNETLRLEEVPGPFKWSDRGVSVTKYLDSVTVTEKNAFQTLGTILDVLGMYIEAKTTVEDTSATAKFLDKNIKELRAAAEAVAVTYL